MKLNIKREEHATFREIFGMTKERNAEIGDFMSAMLAKTVVTGRGEINSIDIIEKTVNFCENLEETVFAIYALSAMIERLKETLSSGPEKEMMSLLKSLDKTIGDKG